MQSLAQTDQVLVQPARAAILAGHYYVPYELIGGPEQVERLKKQLTFKSKYAEPDEPPIEMFRDWREHGRLGVPRSFGLRAWPLYPVDDRTTLGAEIRVSQLPDPFHERGGGEKQARFMEELYEQLLLRGSFVACADTGCGKTVSALHAAARLGRRTFVLVHLQRLADQWIEEIHSKLGVPYDRIGIVQGPRCEWRDRQFCVGLYQSVVRRRYEASFYRAFGTLICDEVHKVGTKFFAPSVPMFWARYKLGLSATVERDDGAHCVFHNHLGPIAVHSDAESMPLTVYAEEYVAPGKLWGKNREQRILCLSRDHTRNYWLAGLITRLYAAGRRLLVVSFSVDHVQTLMQLAEGQGVPRDVMGQWTGEIRLDDGRCIKPRKAHFEAIKSSQTIRTVFATYGAFREGVDLPWLDAGLDATPEGKAVQLVGRVRRYVPGKKQPIWVTPVDARCPISRRLFEKRCRDYASIGAHVRPSVSPARAS